MGALGSLRDGGIRFAHEATLLLMLLLLCLSGILSAQGTDVEAVKAAEMAFNAAQNAGKLDGMRALALDDRTVFPWQGGRLLSGWDRASNGRRQAAFDAGRRVSWRIENLDVRVNGDTAIATFERVGTIREVDGTIADSHTRATGVWFRKGGQWKLAHRHESPF